jgi:hypothetical protein
MNLKEYNFITHIRDANFDLQAMLIVLRDSPDGHLSLMKAYDFYAIRWRQLLHQVDSINEFLSLSIGSVRFNLIVLEYLEEITKIIRIVEVKKRLAGERVLARTDVIELLEKLNGTPKNLMDQMA